MTAFVANTNLLSLVGLKSNITGVAISDATVNVTITDKDGVAVEIEDDDDYWPLTMDHVSGGDYRAVLSHTLPLLERQTYVALITADAGTDRQGQWQFRFTPVVRRGDT